MMVAGIMVATLLMSPSETFGEVQGAKPTVEERVGYLDNGRVRIGVNLDLGGAITFLAPSGVAANMINSYDWGRQIQMSHYSGPIPFAPNGKPPQESWAGLGWNPIQSGDFYGHRSKLLEYKNNGKSIYVRCIPMQWPLNDEPGECTFECWITLVGNTAQVRSRMVNRRSDMTQYTGRDQELPAVYTNGPWHRLVSYTGDRPFENDLVSPIPAKFPWTRWQATENWAALVNDRNEGLGIWQPGVTTFLGGFAGDPGSGGAKDFPTGYIAPLHQEILDHNITYEYRYTLIVGSLDEIRRTVYAQPRSSRLPRFRFARDRQHWWYWNAKDAGWPIRDELRVSLNEQNPQLLSPTGFWRAEAAPRLVIEAAFDTTQKDGRIFWARADAPGFSGERSLPLAVVGDGKFRKYTVDLSSSPEYRGAIVALRWDPVPGGEPGALVRIRSIGFR
ncbi:MAG: hypothetical protein ACOYON_15660 [Fimbriimonas sp.]